MSKAQTGFNGTLKPVAVEKRTRQGNGRRSRPSHGRKLPPWAGQMINTEDLAIVRRLMGPDWEPGDGTMDGAQLVDGEWWHPISGCDALQGVIDRARLLMP